MRNTSLRSDRPCVELNCPNLTDKAMDFLEGCDRPGKLREPGNKVSRMLISAQDRVLGAGLIPRQILKADQHVEGADRRTDEALAVDGPLKDGVELTEMRILRETLTRLR